MVNQNLQSIQENLDKLRDLMPEKQPFPERKLAEIGILWDSIHPQSPQGEYIAPMTRLRRFLESITEKESEYGKLVSDSERIREHARLLTEAHNKLADLLALPRLPDV